MTECPNDEMRDLLPELAQGTLAPSAAVRVRAHVGACAACAAELAVLETTRLVLRARAPRVDTAAIVAAIGAPTLRVIPGGATAHRFRQGPWMPRQLLAAAASLLIIGALALPSVRQAFLGAPGRTIGDSLADVVAGSSDLAGIALAGGLADLSDDDLAALLAELDGLEATVAAEPTTMRTPLVDSPEGP
jgi:hypothetical protein